MKKENGVSMIELVVVMIILVLIAAFAISSGLDTVDEAKITEVYAEMRSIEEAVNGISTLKVTSADPETFDLSPYYNGVLTVQDINAYTNTQLPSLIKESMIASGNTYYTLNGVISEESYSDAVGKALGLGTIKRNYIISFDSQEVILIGGAPVSGGRIYTLKQVEQIVEYGEIIDTSCPPIFADNTPTEPSVPPVEPSDPPVEPSDPPVEPSDPPVEPSDPPEEPVTELVNVPAMRTGMSAVYWNSSGTEIKSGDAGYDPDLWYDYAVQVGNTVNGGTSKWANAKLSDGSYFVWIPRYAYKITYYTDATKTTQTGTVTAYGSIDVLFMNGTSSTKYINRVTMTESDLPAGYVVHPVFTSDISKGGWDSELTGIWVGKYEAARSDATLTKAGRNDTTLKVVPNVISYVNISIGNAYTYALGYNSSLNSHLTKNSEWGAVAYLAHSQYGRNGSEVTINNNMDTITGCGGSTVSAWFSQANYYNTTYGLLASTTGNRFGVYDMSGGSWEYLAAYYTGGGSDLTTNGASFVLSGGIVNTTGTRYATAYSGVDQPIYYKDGDATYETGLWNADTNDFFTSTYPFTMRGGSFSATTGAGVFNSVDTNGAAVDTYGFRMSLAF